MIFNALVDLAFIAIGALETLGVIGGLLFLVLAIAYIYEDNNDGNLFWFLDKWYDKWEDK